MHILMKVGEDINFIQHAYLFCIISPSLSSFPSKTKTKNNIRF